MISATTDRLEVKFNSSGEAIRAWLAPVQRLNVYQVGGEPPTGVIIFLTDTQVMSQQFGRSIAVNDFAYGLIAEAGRARVAAPLEATEHESRMTEMSWLSSQRDLCIRLASQWVAVQGERLIAYGQRLTEVLETSRAKGIEHPFVVCLPEVDEDEVAIIA